MPKTPTGYTASPKGGDRQSVSGGDSLGADHLAVIGGDNRGPDHQVVIGGDNRGPDPQSVTKGGATPASSDEALWGNSPGGYGS